MVDDEDVFFCTHDGSTWHIARRGQHSRLVCVVLHSDPSPHKYSHESTRIENGRAGCSPLFLLHVHHVPPSARPTLLEGSSPPPFIVLRSHSPFVYRTSESHPMICYSRTSPSPAPPSRSRPKHPPKLPSKLPVSVTPRHRVSLVTSRQGTPTPRTALPSQRPGQPRTSSSLRSSLKITLPKA